MLPRDGINVKRWTELIGLIQTCQISKKARDLK